jgi:predicted ATPase
MINQKNENLLGSAPSIVQEFTIHGLYGYRTISLKSDYSATILIAKNGSGKTTLLGALDAFLNCQFGRLSGLEFSSITCKLAGLQDVLTVNFSDVLSMLKIPENSELMAWSKACNLDPNVLLDFVDNEFPTLKKLPGRAIEHTVFEAIRSKVSYSSIEAKKIFERLSDSLQNRNLTIDRVRTLIKSVIKDVEIVYLPTYRRIELPLSNELDESKRAYGRKKPSVRTLLGLTGRSLFNADIQFGLSDISERLAKLNQEILFNSNEGYREISANIINELIGGAFERDNPTNAELPDKESLLLFFSRLRDGRGMGPYSDVAIPDIDKIYSGENVSTQSDRFLTYFLSKLNTVINATRGIEMLVEEFIKNCNKYLSAQDESTDLELDIEYRLSRPTTLDDKILRLDRRTLRVTVESRAAKKRISLDSLSSGEKQMISLFARLYLYPGPKIVLIDEPELSLSIDWQKKILVDVVSAPSCAQVIAITHSPFVFENELEPFARTLLLTVDNPVQRSLLEGDDNVSSGDDESEIDE